jgi:hypothetical protein
MNDSGRTAQSRRLSAMNTSDFRDSGTPKDGRAAPSGALMSALTTEHYTLQSSRTATILEANRHGSVMYRRALPSAPPGRSGIWR